MKINNDIIATSAAVVCLAVLLTLVMITGGKKPAPKMTAEEKALIDNADGTMRVLTTDSEEDTAILRQQCTDFDIKDIDSEHFRKLAKLMVDTMTSTEQGGVGIAGPQVGLSRRVVAVQRFDKEGEPVEVYPNILIEEYRGEMQPGREGCLSVPELKGSVMRYREILVSYINPATLERTEETVKGFTAVIFQHEADHLDGILYTDKADSITLPIAPEHWIAEDESGEMQMSLSDNTLDIIAPEGLTLWYDNYFTGEYEISYDICMPMDGCGHDRLSDLNCFWAAKDPLHPDDITARSEERNGVFPKYNMLDLFYVGYGGNHNTTTRFRRYYGSRYGLSNDEVKPLIKEYTDPEHLLVPGKWYSIAIRVTSESTTFHVNGEKLFEASLLENSDRLFAEQMPDSGNTPDMTGPTSRTGTVGDGHFAIRLLENHVRLRNLTISRE